LFLASGEDKPVILCQNPDLAKALESENGLSAALKSRSQFDRSGWRLVFRAATAYESARTLYDYLAVKLG
jgi:hypothetical protein